MLPSSPPPPGRPVQSRARGKSAQDVVVAVVAAATVAAVILVLVASGVLRGAALIVTAAVVGLAVPTSRELSRRVLVLGCVMLGWSPFLWWWRIPSGDLGRTPVLVAVLAGALTAWTVLRPGPRWRRLLPVVHTADAAAAVGAVAAVWLYAPTLTVRSPEGALSGFLRAWDNVAHFDITEMIRAHGTLVGRTPEGPLGAWSYAHYPQGFHATTAAVMELLSGPVVREPGAELVSYAHAMTIVVVTALVTVVAGLCSLPALRRRGALALPLVLFVVATFGLGPGGMLLHNGFPNFYVASALLACVPLLVAQLTRPGSPALLLALGGAVVGIAHNWSFLMTMAAFGVVAVLFPLRHARWPSDRQGWLVTGLITLGTLVGVGTAFDMLRGQSGVGSILTLGGPIDTVPLSPLVATALLAVALCVGLLPSLRRSRRPFGDDAMRSAWSGLVPLAGVAVAATFAQLQTERVGQPQYYFWKYAIALQLLSAVVIALCLPYFAPRSRVRGFVPTVAGPVASVLAGAAVLQLYGLPARIAGPLGGGVAPGGLSRADFAAIQQSPVADAGTVLVAARGHLGSPEQMHILLPFPASPTYPEPGSTPPPLLQQWFLSLTGRFTEPANLLVHTDPPVDQTVRTAVTEALFVLEANPVASVVVGPQFVDGVRAGVADRGWQDRVLSW